MRKTSTLQAQASMDASIPVLPEEIVEEILARLPVKSLLKFRCVSKRWLALISSSRFIKAHLNNSTNNRSLSNHKLVASCPNLKQCSLRSLVSGSSTYAFNIDFPNKYWGKDVCIVGSCNGLICLTCYEKFFLLNPATREFKAVPPVEILGKAATTASGYGFGFCEPEDDYKVVRLVSTIGKGNAPVCDSIVTVYSLKSDSWKRLENLKGCIPLHFSGKFARGKLHWRVGRSSGWKVRWDILSVDLQKETYEFVDRPTDCKYGDLGFTLGVLGECLYLLCNYQEKGVDLWVLKEYGVKESWSKVATVPVMNDYFPFLVGIEPLLVLENGESFWIFRKKVVVFDLKDNGMRVPEMRNLGFVESACVCVESLVSLSSLEDQGKNTSKVNAFAPSVSHNSDKQEDKQGAVCPVCEENR